MPAAVSGYGRESDRQIARDAGIEHHFVKPIAFQDLRTLLASVRAGA